MSDAKLLVLLEKSPRYKNVKLLKWMSEKVVYGVTTFKGETLLGLDKSGYYMFYIILYYVILYYNILCYIILSYIIFYHILI